MNMSNPALVNERQQAQDALKRQAARLHLKKYFWIIVYVAITLAPLFVVLVGPNPPGRGFLADFSIALGFCGLAMMGLQFALTARFRRVALPYGLDNLYHFHRHISIVAFLMILAHPILLFIHNPATLALLNPVTAPWRARFGLASLVLLIALVGLSVFRQRIKLEYDIWRYTHGILAVLIVFFALWHVLLVNYYVSLPWKQALWTTQTLGWVLLLAYVRLVKPFMMLRRPYRVVNVQQERGGAWTLEIEPDGHEGMKFKPGQFAWLTLWASPFATKEHPFSFSSSASRPGRFSFTVKALGDFTRRFNEVTLGTRVYIDGPYGIFTVDRSPAAGFFFISGGVGITPIMSMLRTMADRGDPRPVTLIAAHKTWDDVMFREEIEELEKRLNLEVVYVLDEAPEHWTGEVGYVTAEMLERYLPEDRESRDYFICGPLPMMNAVEKALVSHGAPLDQIHNERFNLV
jgi:predicted ferric reductase